MEFLVCVSFGLLARGGAVPGLTCQSLTVSLSFSLSLLSLPLCFLLPLSVHLSHCTADKVNDDFYSKRRHLAELAAKGNLPLHPVRVEDEPRAFSPEHGPAKPNGQKSRTNKMPPPPPGLQLHRQLQELGPQGSVSPAAAALWEQGQAWHC